MIDGILAYALSFWGCIDELIGWAMDHPDAAAFYVLLVNTIIQKMPWRGADDLIAIVGKALSAAYNRKLKTGDK